MNDINELHNIAHKAIVDLAYAKADEYAILEYLKKLQQLINDRVEISATALYSRRRS